MDWIENMAIVVDDIHQKLEIQPDMRADGPIER